MEQETIMRCGDSKVVLQEFNDNSIDMLCCDPPYSYGFMGKSWDKVFPDTEIWRECHRVLKPGAFITVMAAPRTDVLWRISRDLEEAGFDLSFSNIEWVYHSGFPKATDISKSIDKRLGDLEHQSKRFNTAGKIVDGEELPPPSHEFRADYGAPQYEGKNDLSKKYEGSKAGFQPKPAREIIIVGMKPFSEGSYIDKVLNFEALPENIKMTYPLIQTPKPAKKEKDFGLDNREPQSMGHTQSDKCIKCGKWRLRASGESCNCEEPETEWIKRKNNHPTVKPIKLMSYLITLFTRPGDFVLDPFGGSGTTGLACKLLDRNHIYIDFTQEYYDIAEERFQVTKEDLKKLLKYEIQQGS
jgi:site-specific DNA-methyltransferase (adenine-specific)